MSYDVFIYRDRWVSIHIYFFNMNISGRPGIIEAWRFAENYFFATKKYFLFIFYLPQPHNKYEVHSMR